MKSRKKALLITALCAVSMMGMGSLALSSGLAYIAREFSGVGIVWIQLLVTCPVLLQVPMGLLAGWLSTKFSKKSLIVVSIAVFLICGLLPFFVHLFPLILIMRVFYGGAIGLSTTLSGSMAFEYFLEEDERSRVFGLTGAFGMMGGTYYTLIGGFLSEIGWQYCFLAYLIGIPILVLVLLFLPNDKAPQMQASAGSHAVYPLKAEVYWIAFLFLIYFTLYFAYTNNISTFVLNSGMGGSSESGWSYTIVNFSGFLGGLSFHLIHKHLRYWTLPFSVAATCLGFFFIAASARLPVLFLGSFLIGISIGWYTPNNSILYGEIMPPEAMTFTLGVTGAIGNIGQIVSTFAFAGMAAALRITSERGVLFLAGYGYIFLVAVCVVYIALRIRLSKTCLASKS